MGYLILVNQKSADLTKVANPYPSLDEAQFTTTDFMIFTG